MKKDIIKYLKVLVKRYPNDQELGRYIRDIIHKNNIKEIKHKKTCGCGIDCDT